MSAETHGAKTTSPPNAGAARGLLGEAGRLLTPVWPLAALATGLGVVSGAATVAFLAEVNAALGAGLTTGGAAWLASLLAIMLGATFGATLGNAALGQRVVARLRRELCDRILAAPLSGVERVGEPRLLAALTEDLEILSMVTLNLAPLMVAIATVLGGLGYLAILSPPLFLLVAAALAAGVAAHGYARAWALGGLAAARGAQERLFSVFRALVGGAKEVRMSRARRRRLREAGVDRAVDEIAQRNVAAAAMFAAAAAASGALFFGAVIGVLGFGRGAEGGVLSAFVILLLFLRGPIEQIVAAAPTLSRAQIALRHAAALRAELVAEAAPAAFATPAPAGFERIALEGAVFQYPPQDGAPGFRLGPIDLELRRGETLFITGENGAGKTTLLKVLVGLYAPIEGRLLRDGQAVGAAERDGHRQLFSTVFSDFHLFEELLAARDVGEADIADALAWLKLSETLSAEGGRLSTLSLSTGQKKRLALLHAYLERRPILAFDEWAAEQDPIFRRWFYEELLAKLKAEGRTVVAISHDDRFFHHADRCVEIGAGAARTVD